MDSTLQDILKRVDQLETRIHETLSDLVSFRSTNPCNQEGAACQDYMASRLRSLGFKVSKFESSPGVPNVIGEAATSSGDMSLLLTGHVDVVCANPEDWKTPPFQATILGDKMYGRGTSDMKGSLAGFLIALEAVLSVVPNNTGQIKFASVFGEEIADSGTRFIAENTNKPTFAILGEPSRGSSVHASIGLMKLTVTIKDEERLHLGARRQFIRAGGGLIGGNSIEKMANHVIPGLQGLEGAWGITKIHQYLPVGQALISPFRIQGGEEIAINPQRCDLDVAVLYLPNEMENKVKREIEKHLKSIAACDYWLRIHPPICNWYPPSYLPAELPTQHKAFQLLCDVYGEITGKKMQTGGRGAITDAGWLHRQGIPVVVYGAGDISTAHGSNEYIHLDDLLRFTKVMAAFIYKWEQLY